jgi:hypothetical protein
MIQDQWILQIMPYPTKSADHVHVIPSITNHSTTKRNVIDVSFNVCFFSVHDDGGDADDDDDDHAPSPPSMDVSVAAVRAHLWGSCIR